MFFSSFLKWEERWSQFKGRDKGKRERIHHYSECTIHPVGRFCQGPQSIASVANNTLLSMSAETRRRLKLPPHTRGHLCTPMHCCSNCNLGFKRLNILILQKQFCSAKQCPDFEYFSEERGWEFERWESFPWSGEPVRAVV